MVERAKPSKNAQNRPKSNFTRHELSHDSVMKNNLGKRSESVTQEIVKSKLGNKNGNKLRVVNISLDKMMAELHGNSSKKISKKNGKVS